MFMWRTWFGSCSSGVTTAPAGALPARTSCAWSTTPRSSPPSTAAGRADHRPGRRPPPPRRTVARGRRPDRRLRRAVRDGARARLLEAHDRFSNTDTRALHHPVSFHQFGPLRRPRRDGRAERRLHPRGDRRRPAGVPHLLTVRTDRRRSGSAIGSPGRLRRRHGTTGARVVRRSPPDNAAAMAFHTARTGGPACPATTPGPANRVVLTRSLPRP